LFAGKLQITNRCRYKSVLITFIALNMKRYRPMDRNHGNGGGRRWTPPQTARLSVVHHRLGIPKTVENDTSYGGQPKSAVRFDARKRKR